MIKKIWRKYVTRPTKFEGSKLPLKYAFTANGIDYYEPENVEQLPWMRALTLHQYYEELRMKVDREYLEQHAQAVDVLINGTKDKPKKRFTFEDLGKLNRVNNMLKERLQFIFTPDLVYKVASVIFIDESENPAKYDEVHNRKKIEQWKANGLDAFFLNEPVQRLIPFLNSSPQSIKNYGEQVNEIQQKMLTELESIFLSGQQDETPA